MSFLRSWTSWSIFVGSRGSTVSEGLSLLFARLEGRFVLPLSVMTLKASNAVASSRLARTSFAAVRARSDEDVSIRGRREYI